jgi:hypothetical protein
MALKGGGLYLSFVGADLRKFIYTKSIQVPFPFREGRDIRGDMMRKWLGRICALLVIAMMVSVAMSSAACHDPPQKTVKLWAGQTYLAAYITLTYENDGDLRVYFNMQGSWKIYETHIQVETDWDDVPQTKKGNLKTGQFEYKKEWPSGSGDVTITVPAGMVPSSGELIIIIHAVVMRPVPCGFTECICYQSETGWANACSIPNLVSDETGGSGWATWVSWDP